MVCVIIKEIKADIHNISLLFLFNKAYVGTIIWFIVSAARNKDKHTQNYIIDPG